MTRDYAKKTNRRNKNQRHNSKPKGTPGWIWLLAGILIGALVSILIKLPEAPQQDTPEPTGEKKSSKTPEPRFDFYTLLRETEVIVPESETPSVSETSKKQDSVFLLQVGSFKNAADADSLRARLLLLNLHASIETVTPRPRETWHRVLVGPFASNSALAEARAKLASNQIDSLLLKRKQY